jgi:hypothetical protein
VYSVCQHLKKVFTKSRYQQSLSSYLPFLFESKYIRTERILKCNGKVLEGISSDQKGGVGTPLGSFTYHRTFSRISNHDRSASFLWRPKLSFNCDRHFKTFSRSQKVNNSFSGIQWRKLCLGHYGAHLAADCFAHEQTRRWTVREVKSPQRDIYVAIPVLGRRFTSPVAPAQKFVCSSDTCSKL